MAATDDSSSLAPVTPWRVLNVNDDEGARRYKTALLRAAGFEVSEASRGGDVERTLTKITPDLILLDVHLPDDNGVEICRRLQPANVPDAFEGDRPFAIVLISAHVTQPDDIARGIAAGADAYLVEPLDDAYLIGTVRAIAERHRRRTAAAKERVALRARDYRYRVLSATIGDAMYEWDLTTDAVEWSDAVHRVLQHEPGTVEPTSQWWMNHVHPADRQRVASEAARAIARKRSTLEQEYRFIRGDGSYAVIVDRSTFVYGDDGQPLRSIGVMSDVTERRRLADQLRLAQKLETVGLLAGGIAHDFNNVLTSIVGFADLVRHDTQMDPTIADHVDEITAAAGRGTDLVAQLLAFSRKQVLEPEILDLNEVIRSNSRMLDRLIGAHISVSYQLAPRMRAVRVDRTQIQQVLLNLVVNARDAMPDGGGLTVSTAVVSSPRSPGETRTVPAGRYVQILVRDTGAGMDERTQARIFEPFFTTKERGRGTGLGLATVYGIVQQSGGFIKVESTIGRGTAMEILLPVVDAPRQAADADAVEPAAQPSGGETILLVEFEPTVRRLASEMLERAGYRVLCTADGAEAVSLAASHAGAIDLLMADLVIPGVSAIELARTLRVSRPTLRVLYTSGYGADVAHINGSLHDANLLLKPFSHETLAQRVGEILQASAALPPLS